MANKLTWNDAPELGILLSQRHPRLEPLAVPLADLHRYVKELPDFGDDPGKPDAIKLEAIQTAWLEEFLDRTRD